MKFQTGGWESCAWEDRRTARQRAGCGLESVAHGHCLPGTGGLIGLLALIIS